MIRGAGPPCARGKEGKLSTELCLQPADPHHRAIPQGQEFESERSLARQADLRNPWV